MKYKGTPTALGDIPLGSPIEVITPSEWKIPLGLSVPLLGILFKRTLYQKTSAYIELQVWNGKEFAQKVTLYGAKYDDNTYRDLGVPLTSQSLSIMSGSMSTRMTSTYPAFLMADGVKVRGAIYGSCGADPEIFITDPQGVVVPAWEFLPSKIAPISHKCFYGNGAAYWDGFQAEFTVSPSGCANATVDSVRAGLKAVLEAARAKDPLFNLSLESVVRVPTAMLADATTEQISLGCLPSLNAYGESGAAETVEDPRSLPFRFAGGHVHIGDRRTHPDPNPYVKILDRLVGVASVGMFEGLEDPIRRRFYGRAGEYRLPSHGLEYRVLGNAWLCHPAITFWVFDMVRSALGMHVQGLEGLVQGTEEEAQEIINSYDIEGARRYCNRNATLYQALCKDRYGEAGAVYIGGGHMTNKTVKNTGDITLRMINEGIGSVVNPSRLVENWMLDKPEKSYVAGAKGDDVWLTHAESPNVMFKSLCARIAMEAGEQEVSAVGV